MGLIINILEQGFIFGIMVFGVYITYRLLDFPDLSVDGTFPLGAAITTSAMLGGMDPWLATAMAFLGGSLAGGVTAFLHVKLGITNLLSGILVMTGVYSINLRIMGRANIPLFQQSTIFTKGFQAVLLLGVIVVLIKILLDIFLKTRLGFLIRAVGDNPVMVTSLGLDLGKVKFAGLMLSNGIVALAGSIMAQHQGFADVGMGTGIVVMGLASIIIGEMVFKKVPLLIPTTMILLGSILYKASTALALRLGLPATDLKLITTVIVVLVLAIYGRGRPFPFIKKAEKRGESLVANTKSI